MEQILRINHLEKYYGKGSILTKAIDDISFEVCKGEFVGIMGASGSGKSTLLNCISTIDTPTGGEIFLNKNNISKIPESGLAKFRRENLGFVFQDFNLLDTLTVEENIGLSLIINHENEDDIKNRIDNISAKLGIHDILKKFPYEISGGQKQRCACGRALVNEPTLLLADEPTGALDSNASMMLMNTFQKINERDHATILMVTHDVFSASFCSRILFLKDGKIFSELVRGDRDRKELFSEIMDITALLGGESNVV